MTGSQGREGRSRGAWLAATLVASGLSLGSGARAAQIHHERHHDWKSADHEAGSSTDHHRGDLHDLKDWHEHAMSVPPDVHGYSAATSGMTHPAADLLVSDGKDSDPVKHWHHHHHHMWTPPTPTSSTAATSTIGAPASGVAGTSTALSPPAAAQVLLSSPTPAPEPSTIVSALALVGVFAWRRRSRG